MSANGASLPDGLISVLLDRTASGAERDDAAMDLGAYDDKRVLEVLLAVAADPAEDQAIAGSAGESIAEIWLRTGEFDRAVLARLAPVARAEALGLVRSQQPEWLADTPAAP